MKGNEALSALWEALECPYTSPPPNAITTEDVALKFGIKRRAASERLQNQVKSGTLECGRFILNGHFQNFYWLAEKKGKRAKKSQTS